MKTLPIRKRKEIGNVKFTILKKEKVTEISIKIGTIVNIKYLLHKYNQPAIMLLRKCKKLALTF